MPLPSRPIRPREELIWIDSTVPVSLTPRERTHLKGRTHALEPIVQVGQGGFSDAVMLELERALTAHGLNQTEDQRHRPRGAARNR
jgi:hypothetical protein